MKFQIFNGEDGQEGRNTSPCQILLKSAQTRPRYRDLWIFQDGLICTKTFVPLHETDTIVSRIFTARHYASAAYALVLCPSVTHNPF